MHLEAYPIIIEENSANEMMRILSNVEYCMLGGLQGYSRSRIIWSLLCIVSLFNMH